MAIHGPEAELGAGFSNPPAQAGRRRSRCTANSMEGHASASRTVTRKFSPIITVSRQISGSCFSCGETEETLM
jgi:hypothetical protein